MQPARVRRSAHTHIVLQKKYVYKRTHLGFKQISNKHTKIKTLTTYYLRMHR